MSSIDEKGIVGAARGGLGERVVVGQLVRPQRRVDAPIYYNRTIQMGTFGVVAGGSTAVLGIDGDGPMGTAGGQDGVVGAGSEQP